MEKDKRGLTIATGFTTAFLGDERTLREFIIGDAVRREYEDKGEEATLILINDNYDPLNFRQLRIGVNKDERLLERFKSYCGRPIAEIPDPYECHSDYSKHFEDLLLKRLSDLNIHPIVIDSYLAYKKGLYNDVIQITFENYNRIKEIFAEIFHIVSMKNLFKVQCPECTTLDETYIIRVVDHVVHFQCTRCGTKKADYKEIRGKLSWKLDCAARWNIYDIDLETFSKAHMTKFGSFEISKFLSEKFYGGRVPSAIRYGDVKISKDLSYRLLQILPPKLLKALFASSITKDMEINREFIENFCNKEEIRPGMSYVEYIKKELPKEVLFYNQLNSEEKIWVDFGNRFSRYLYGKEYRLTFPDPSTIISGESYTVQSAYKIIHYTLTIRDGHPPESEEIKETLKNYLYHQDLNPGVYPYLRRLFGQSEGPSIITLLSILPKDYLEVILAILRSYLKEDEKDEVNQEILNSTVINHHFSRM